MSVIVTQPITYLYFVFKKKMLQEKQNLSAVFFMKAMHLCLTSSLWRGQRSHSLIRGVNESCVSFPQASTINSPTPVHLKEKYSVVSMKKNLYRCLYSILSKCQVLFCFFLNFVVFLFVRDVIRILTKSFVCRKSAQVDD